MAKGNKKELKAADSKELIKTLKARFEKNMHRHNGMDWAKVQTKLDAQSDKLWSLNEMEATGGEPDVVGFDKKTGEYIFYDCSAESPKERRSLCYDQAALDGRKENKPKGNALTMAATMGIEILSEEEYNLPGGGGGHKSLKVRESVRRPSLVGVYPNPAIGEFYITYVLPTERESAFIHIFDLQGKLVSSENITSGYGILGLNAKQFAAGSYVFELELNGQKVATEKFQIVE